MFPHHVRYFVLLCLLALASPAFPQEWTRFRGPDGTGLSNANIPAKWSDNDYNWKITLPGGGHSSPVVWGDKIFVTCADDSNQPILLCISAADGKTLWQSRHAVKAFTKKKLENSYASSTPAVDDKHVYTLLTSPEQSMLIALDHDGKDVWKVNLGNYKFQHGPSGTSPIVVGDLVLFANDQEDTSNAFLLAVDRNTGQTKWKLPRAGGNKASTSTPCVYQPQGQPPLAVFSSNGEGLTAIDAYTGEVAWSVPDAMPFRCVSSPVAGGGLVFAQSGEGAKNRSFIAVRPPSSRSAGQTATVAFKLSSPKDQNLPYVTCPLAKGDLLFLWGDDGLVRCLQLSTGKLLWQQNFKVPAGFFSSPVCAGNNIYCVSRKGEVVVIAAADKYQPLARMELGELCHATPAISGGRMYLRTFTHLFSVGGK